MIRYIFVVAFIFKNFILFSQKSSICFQTEAHQSYYLYLNLDTTTNKFFILEQNALLFRSSEGTIESNYLKSENQDSKFEKLIRIDSAIVDTPYYILDFEINNFGTLPYLYEITINSNIKDEKNICLFDMSWLGLEEPFYKIIDLPLKRDTRRILFLKNLLQIRTINEEVIDFDDYNYYKFIFNAPNPNDYYFLDRDNNTIHSLNKEMISITLERSTFNLDVCDCKKKR